MYPLSTTCVTFIWCDRKILILAGMGWCYCVTHWCYMVTVMFYLSTCSQQRYVTVLHYMFVPTLTFWCETYLKSKHTSTRSKKWIKVKRSNELVLGLDRVEGEGCYIEWWKPAFADNKLPSGLDGVAREGHSVEWWKLAFSTRCHRCFTFQLPCALT